MCCNRGGKREKAGKCPSMEIDEGPPPFHGNVVDDSSPFDDDHQNMTVDSEDLLPLPDVGRSRSVTPTSEVNHKGDTTADSLQIPSEKSETHEESEEDDDDWGDFGTAAAPVQQKQLPSSVPALQMEKDDDDDDEEWAAFEHSRPSMDRPESDSGPDSARSEAARQLAHQQSLEAWGAADGDDDDDDDDWQAEFSSAPPAPAALQTPSAPMEKLKILEEMLDDDEFWDDGFQEQEEELSFQNELSVSDIQRVFDSETLAEEAERFGIEEQRYAQLWLSLRVVEEAISLKFDWKNSEVRGNHFKSLKINPKTVQKTARPAKFDTSELLLPTPVVQTSSSSEDHQMTSSLSDPSESPSIPAADFDWDTSGLTNPMNRANQSSAIIDVDFLSTNGVATSYVSPLQHELEQFGLTLEKGAGSGATSLNGSNILETIMSSSNASLSSRSPYRNSAELSLDAQKLLEKLPDLQYLQSEVLMFPVGTNLGSH